MSKDIDFTKLKCIGEGRGRRVFLLPSGKNVIKVPLNEDGIHDNMAEAFRFRKQRKAWFPLARCMMWGQYLIMEYIEPVYGFGDLMKQYNWVGMVDCCQVGYNRAGKLVAFDYGIT